jgi:ankyrin repeat protein
VNATTKSGLIPLYIAVNKGDAQVVTIIVENGGNVNFVLREKKLVEIALSKGHHEIVGTLLFKGATVGPTVLWEAVRVGDTSLVKNLLQGDVDVNYVHKGWSIYGNDILLIIT